MLALFSHGEYVYSFLEYQPSYIDVTREFLKRFAPAVFCLLNNEILKA